MRLETTCALGRMSRCNIINGENSQELNNVRLYVAQLTAEGVSELRHRRDVP